MNILLVNSAAPDLWGGGEKWFIDAAQWFQRHGQTAALAARPGSKLLARVHELKLETVPCRFGGDFDPLAMLRAREIIRATHADVVVTNFNKESWQFGVAGKTLGIPVVARHGFTLWSKKLRHKVLAQKILLRLIVNAERIRDAYAAIGVAPKDIVVIPNGVQAVPQQSGELRRKLGIGPNTLLLVAAGRLESQKRFDRLLDYAAALKQPAEFTLAIFGRGPLENELQARAIALGLQDKAVFRGFDPEFASLIGDADLFLLTSSEEGTPNVVLEAMSSGVPVLGFDVGSMNKLLSGELSEFLVPADNDEEFTRRLTQWAADPANLRSRRKAFQTRVETEFSFDHAMTQYLQALTEVTARA